MNHIYRLIWNAELLRWIVAPEIARRHGKPTSLSRATGHRSLGHLFDRLHDTDAAPPPWRWKSALCYLLAFQQLLVPSIASAQSIIADGRTQTAIATSGAVTNITTGTVRGNNAFNSFQQFSVGQGKTANLFLPNGTLNLINLVRDQRTTIDGILNAIKDGRIGGNVYFANPNGFLISASGIVNVGSLNLSTPTPAFIDSFFTGPGNPNDASVAALLNGTAARNANALISIQGQVNAIDGITLSAGAINVGGSLYSGARFIGSAPDFSDVVNANGLASATNVVVREGRIEIVADNDVTVSGTIATPGGSGVRGGDIAIRAGGNVDLQAGANIVARGNGLNSAGGAVNIWADNDAIARSGARVDASAGSSGDGGAIEFSARRNIELAGGQFVAEAPNGRLGSVLIDPTNVTVSANYYSGGANHSIVADENITVNSGVVVSTRNVVGGAGADQEAAASAGNSGNLSLQAGTINLASGSKLLAHADNGFTGGDITLSATRNWTGEAKIDVDNATIRGRNVSLTAAATYNDSALTSWLPVSVPVTVSTIDIRSGRLTASGTLNLGATSLIDVSSSGLSPLGSIVAVSTATVDVTGASVLSSGGASTLAASSTVTAKATPGGPNPATLPGDAGVALNVVVSTAKAHVGGSSSVTAGGALDVTASNAVSATTKADASAGGAVAIGGTVALSEVTSVTQAVIDGTAQTQSAALKVAAESTSTVTTSAKAASKGATKQTAAEKAAAPSKSEETLGKYKDQTTTADGSVDVAAAVAIANVNNIVLASIESSGTQTSSGAASVTSKAASSSTVTADGSSASGTVGVGAAVGVNVGVLVNQARVADNASVSSHGLTVGATQAAALPKNSFVTSATSGAGASNVGVAGALGVNVLVNTTTAAVEGGGAGSVNLNGGDLLVEAGNASESKVTVGASVKPAGGGQPAAVGVGASVGMNVAVNTTTAEIENDATVNSARNVDLTATADHTTTTDVTGGAAGADISVTPVAAITVAVNTTSARLGSGSQLNLGGAFTGNAEQTSTTTSTATGQTQGNNVAVGASIAVNSATDTVSGEIDRDIQAAGDVAIGAKSTARSSASATASVSGGEKASSNDAPPAKPDGSAGQSVDQKVTAQGSAAKTTGKKTAASAPPAASSGTGGTAGKLDQSQESPKTEDNSQGNGGISVAAAVGVNVGVATTTAKVGKGRKVTSTGGALKVTSTNETDASAKADGSQVDSGNTSVGVGAAVALNVGISTNTAIVGDDAEINTEGLTVSAVNSSGEKSDFGAEAKSGAGAGNVGVAGSLAANVVVNTTVAALEGDTVGSGNGKGAVVDAGNGDILIEAANATTSTVKSGADVSGTGGTAKVGVGASIGANIGVNTVVAEVADKAELTGGHDLGLNATADHTASTEVSGGAAGAKVAATPLVGVTLAVNTTSARLGDSAVDVGISGQYSSTADHKSSATTTATGQTEGSSVAIGASIGLTIATDTVNAEIARDVSATDGVEVNARSSAKSSTTATASVAGGEKAQDDGSAPAPGGGSGSGQSVDQKVAAQGDAAKDSGKKTATKAPATTPAAGSSAGDKLDGTSGQAPKSEDTTQSGGVAVAAAVGVNVGTATTTAKVGKGRQITSTGGALKVSSTNETDASAKADGSQVDNGSTNVGVGASVALNVGISTNTATVGENSTINTRGLTISAVNAAGEKSDYGAEAKSGAGAANVGVAGSLAANIVVNTTVAALEGDSASDGDLLGASVNAGGGDVLVEAANATTSTVKSGADVKGTGGTAKVGVGASIGMNVGVNTTVAEIGDKSVLTNGGDLGLNATSDHTLTTDVTGGAAGAKVAVTPLAAVTIGVNTTTARLGESATELDLTGKYSSTADHKGSATTTATGQTAGSSVAVGVSIGVTVATDTVTADVERDIDAATGVEVNARSTAKSSTSATASVKGGEKANADGSAPPAGGGSGSGQTVDDKVAGQQDKATAAGKTSAAKAPATTPAAGGSASDKLDGNKQTPPKGETSEGGVSVAAAVGVNVGVATTTAKVGKGRRIASSGGALKVSSVNETDTGAKADGSQVDSSKSTDVGVGAALALNVGTATTTAIVSDETDISTKGLTISATGVSGEKSDAAAEAKSGAGAGNVGVAGSLAINSATNTTVALLEGNTDSDGSVAHVDANGGAVLIEAQNATTSSAKVSADVKGTGNSAKVGVGASIGVNVGVNTTVAEVGNQAELIHAGAVGLNATAAHAMTTEATGGAAGAKVSITPVVAASIAVNTTVARLGDGAATLDAGGAYSSKAEQTSTVTTKATGQAQGDVAVGASLGASIAVDNVSATVERNLDAASGVDLGARSDTSITTEIVAGAKGAKAAKKDASGNETPESGTTVDEQKKNQLDFAKSRNSNAAGVSTDTPEAKTPDTSNQTPGNTKPAGAPNKEQQGKKVSVAAAIGASVAYNQVKAEVAAGKTVGAGTGKLKVAAESDTNYRTLATGEAVSDDVGVAAAVALTATYNKTQANIGSGATVTDAGDVEVSATSRQNRGTNFRKTMSAEAVSGAGGGEVAVAGSLAAVGNWNETRASIDEGVTLGANGAPVGDVSVKADDTSKISAQARAGALSTGQNSKAGVGASFAVLLSYNKNIAAVGYDANGNGSYAPTSIWADSLSVTATKNRVWFNVPTAADAKNFVANDIKTLNFDALDPSTYLGSNNYYTEAIAGAAAKGNVAVAGAFAVNIFGNTTDASIGNSVTANLSGKQPAGEQLGVEVAAHADTQAISFSGAAAGAKKAGVGISNSNIVNLDQTTAWIGDDAVVKSTADGAGVKVDAYARQDIANVSVSAGAATQGAGVAGVLGAIVSLASTEARIGEDAEVKSMGDLNVGATGDITAVLVSGGVAAGQSAGVGASIAGNVLANETRAEIGSGAEVTAKRNLNVAADADETLITAVVAGAGGEKAGVAGALSLNLVFSDTQAIVGQGAKLNTDVAFGGTTQSVGITARDDSVIVGIAGGGAGGGKAGVGAALDTTVLAKTVKAAIADDADGLDVATVNADRNVVIDATASESLTSVSMGFAGGGTAGVGGAVSVAVNKNDVQAGVGKSAVVDSDGNVLINAQDDVTAVLTAGAGAGGGNAGVGGSLAVATLLQNTRAYVGDNATVNARGNGDAATVYSGETVFSDTNSAPGAFLAKKTESAKGLSVTAYNRESLITTVVAGAGGGTAGVAATVSANVIASGTEAAIGQGAKINQNNAGAGADQQVRVKAVDETLLIDSALAAAGGGTAGVGGTGNVGVIVKNTTAKVGKGATVNARKAFELNAASSDVTVAPTAGFAGGGTAGVGGAVAATAIANTTQAYVEDGANAGEAAKINVSGGNLEVSADEFSSSWLTTGTIAGGGTAGVGGALSVGVNASTTKARIGNYAETNATGTTSVSADSVENVNTITVAGGGGGAAGVVGSVSVDVIVSKTEAGIGQNAKVNQNAAYAAADQSVDVSATDKVISVAAAGSGAGGGAAGVGGAATVTVALNTTTAYIDSGAAVAAQKDVSVNASSEKYVNAATIAGAGGGAAGVAGAVSILAVGSLFDSDAKSGLNSTASDGSSTTTQAKADATTTASPVGSALGSSAQSTETKGVVDNKMQKLAVSSHMSDSTPIPQKNTQAYVGYNARVKAGRDVTVSAKDTTLAINANGAGAGGGAAGVAGSLGVTLLHDSAEAFIANGARVDADRSLAVRAETGETVINVGVTGYGGGAAGVGGSGAVNVVSSNTSAYIGDADINQDITASTERSVEVTADSASNLIAVAGSGGGAGAAAVGGVLNVNTLFKNTTAFIGEGASVKADRNVIVAAESAQNIVSAGISIQGAGAAAVGGAATVNVVGNKTEAYIGSARDDSTKTAATVDSDGNVVIAASDDTLLIAVAGSGTGAGAAAVGGAVGANVISSQTRSYVGDNSAINARGNAAGISVDTGTIDNATAGAMPALPSGVSGDVDADRDGVNDGNVSNGASFTLAGGGTSTGVNPSSVKDSQGNSVGNALGGLGAKGKETVKGLSVTATGNEKIVSAAMGVAGAGAAGITATATADVIISTTEARIGDGAQINQSGAVGADPSVRVRAADNSFVVMASGTVAGAAGAGISGSANTAVIAKQTHATIGDADVKGRNVSVQAKAEEDVFVVDANVSFGAAGVGAAVGVAVVTNDTQAGIEAGSTIDATGGITARAQQDTSLDIYTVAGSAGIGAVSGAFSVGVIDNTTRAYVEGGSSAATAATLDAGGKTEISATSTEEITTGTVSAAGGGVGVAGAVGVKVVTSETTAEIGNYTKVNQTRRGGGTQDVQVAATDTVRLNGGGGSGAVGAGYGAGATAEVNIVRNTTTASVGHSTAVRADHDIAVTANSTKDVDAVAVALAGGASAGIAGAVSLAFVGASVQSDSDAKSGIGDGATASKADEKMKADNVASKLGSNEHVQGAKSDISSRSAALGVSGELNDTAGSSRDKTRAYVDHDATLIAGRNIDVTAADKTQINLTAVGAAGGFVGIGAAVGVGITNSTTEAFIGAASKVDALGNVTVDADAANIDAGGSAITTTAAAGGIVGASASVAVLNDTSTTRAYVGSGAEIERAADFTVSAETNRKARTIAYGASAGGLAVGASVTRSSFDGLTAAYLDTGIRIGKAAGKNVGDVIVSATDQSVATASSTAGAAGIAAGAGADAKATVESDVLAYVGNGADVVAQDNVTVSATARPGTDAESLGVSVGAAAVGVSLAQAKAANAVRASVDANSNVTADLLSVTARTDLSSTGYSAKSYARGASGGLIGANGTDSKASYEGSTTAYIAGGSSVIGGTAVKAEAFTRQAATATGFAAGLIAAGANLAKASSTSTTRAYTGDYVKISGGDVSVFADAQDDNSASAVSGSGGVVSGAAAVATTVTTSTTEATVGTSDTTRFLEAENFVLRARHQTLFNGEVDSVNASLVGASGAMARHTVTSTVNAALADNGRVDATDVTILAENKTRKDWLRGTDGDNSAWNIRSGSGGLIDAPAGSSISHITHNTSATIGANADVNVLPSAGINTFNMDAYNEIVARDKAKLDSGGALAIAKAVSHVFVDQANATVGFGANSTVTSDVGDIAAGARSVVDLDTRAAADTYGLAGAPSGEAYSYYTGNNVAEVAAGALLHAATGEVFLAGGQNSYGTPTSINANSKVNLWNKTAFPISTDPDARSNVLNNAAVYVRSGAIVEGAGDISLYADKGSVNATAKGIGKDIYRETAGAVASGISNLFGGGDVSFDIVGGTTSVGGQSLAQVDGIVRTGINRFASLTLNYQLDMSCGAGGNEQCYDSNGAKRWTLMPTVVGDVTYSRDLAVGIAANIQKRIDKLRQLKEQYAGDSVAVAAYESEIRFLQYKLVELGLAANVNGNYVSGKFNSPSPRQAAQDQIGSQQSVVLSFVTTANTSATTLSSTTNTALGNESTLLSNAASIVSSSGTTKSNNDSIVSSLQSLSGYNASNASYISLTTLMADNVTRASTISSQKTLNDTDRATVDTKRTTINTKLTEIETRKTQIGALVSKVVQDGTVSAASQIVTLQAEIDSRQAEINQLATDIKGLLTTISSRNQTINTNSATIVSNNTQIDSLQDSLATSWKGGTAGQNSIYAGIQVLRNANSSAYSSISSLSTTNTNTLQASIASAVTSVGTEQTGINTAVTSGTRTTASALVSSLATDLPTLSTVAASGATADFVKVDDITVRLGSIRTKGDRLAGSGELRAPGDAQINITNNTPNFLVINNLTIDSDNGGTISHNGFLVNSNADINRVNGGGSAAAFGTVLTRDSQGAGIPKPSINITSNYDPNSPVYANLPAPAPDIELNGSITNLRGSVNVLSKAGSILANGAINAGTVNIKAENGDFVQSYVDGFSHVGGDPASIHDYSTPLGQGIIANGSVVISARFLNINSLVQSGIEQWNLTLPSNPVLTGPATLFGISQASVDAALAAYKNTGGPRYTLFSTAAGPVTYDALKERLEAAQSYADADRLTSDWATRTASFSGLYPLVSDYGNIGAYYDPTNTRYEINGTSVRGGYIQLFGQIINTGDVNGANSGKLRVLDGYGQIKINNPTGLAVVINNLDAGADPTGTLRGTAGKIDITDIQGVNADNTSNVIHSVFTRDYNVATGAASVKLLKEVGRLETDGSFTIFSSSNGNDANATDGRNTRYDPQSGLRYVWTTGTDDSTFTYWHFSGAQFLGIESLRTQPSGNVESKSGPFTRSSYRLSDGTYLKKDLSNTGTRYMASTDTRTTSDYWEKTAEWTNCNWWTLCVAQDYHTKWTQTTGTTTITTKSLKADYPIAIEFSGYDRGTVSVNSAADVLLKGAIRNGSGTTTITAGIQGTSPDGVMAYGGVQTANRSIIQASDEAMITSKDLNMAATGSVGGALGSDPARLIATALSGTLNASAANGDVRVRQSLGDLKVGTVTAASASPSVIGSVILEADGNISAASGASLIQANRVELTSENGAIGSIASPLAVNVGYTDVAAQRSKYGLKAEAQGDIGIESRTWSGNTAGNLLLDTVVSTAGDVKLVAPGRIVDNNPIEQIDSRTWADLVAYWDSLGLRDGTAENLAKQEQAIKAFEFGRTADYRLYWQIRQRQANPSVYDPGFVYVASTAERDALTASGMNATQISTFESNRTAQYHQLHGSVGGLNGGTFAAGYAYAASTTERDQILNKSSWTDRELGISISPGLLKTLTNTNPVVKSANVKGVNVTLQAGIAVGETSSIESIPTGTLPQNLTDAQKVALAAAERSDITVTDSLITVARRKPLNFEALNAINVAVTPAVSAHADNGKAFLASQGDGRLGVINVPGETRIKVRGSILNVPTSLVQTGNLILEAANGGIGYVPADGVNPAVSAPVNIDLHAGATLTARAASNIDISESGDLNVDTVYSRGDARLTASGSILDAYADSELNVLADNVTLIASGGSIGTSGNALDVGVELVSDSASGRSNLGRIRATSAAGSGVFLNGPREARFNISSVSSGDAVSLRSDLDMLIDGSVSGPGPFTLAAGGTMTLTPDADVHATTLGVFLRANALVMQDAQRMLDNGETLDPAYVAGDAARMRVDVGTIDIETVGDARITGIQTGNPTASAIRVVSTAGRILDNGDTRLDIIADTPPSAQLTIDGKLGIGADPLDVRLLNLQANSDGGVVDLAVQNSVNIVAVTAGDRVLITAGGDVTGNTVTSAGTASGTDPTNPATGVSITSTGGSVDLAGVSSANDVTINAANNISVDSGQAGGSFGATAGNNIDTGTVSAGSLTYNAGGSIGFDSISTGGNSLLNAVGDISGNTLGSTGGSTGIASSAGSVDISSLAVAQNAGINAAVDINVDSGQAGGSFGATAGNNIDTGTVTAGSLAYNAGGSVGFDSISTGGNSQLNAVGDISGNTLGSTGGSTGIASSAGGVDIGQVAVAGDVRIAAPVSIEVGDMRLGGSAFLASDRITADITGTGSGDHGGTVGGYGGGAASFIDLSLSSSASWRLSSVSALNGSIDVPQGDLWVDSMYVGERMTVSNPQTQLLIDQTSRSLQGFDVQLYTGGDVFQLGLVTNHVYTDALAIGREPTHEVLSSNGNNTSALEQSNDVFTENRNDVNGGIGALIVVDGEVPAVTFETPAVALNGSDESACAEGDEKCEEQ